MHKKIKAVVKCRVATAPAGAEIVCGNTGYTVTFTFDEEWAEHPDKTARFKFLTPEGPQHYDQDFTGDTVEVPPLANTREVEVGVYVGSLATTTGAFIRCRPSIRCGRSTRSADVALGVVDAILDDAGVEGDTPEEKTQALADKVEAAEDRAEELEAENEALEAENEALEASIKTEQEKTVTITENGTTEITPDKDKTLSKVKVNVEVPTSGGTEELENLIDQSGVLGTTDETATATEKVEALIDKAQWEKYWYEQSGKWTGPFPSGLFVGAKIIPRLNYENAIYMRSTFVPSLVESIDYYINCGKAIEITRTFQSCSTIKFLYGIDMSNCENCQFCFQGCEQLETIQEPLNFSNVTNNGGCFSGCDALRDIRFYPETIPISTTFTSKELTVDSAKSIILGLKNYSEDNNNAEGNNNAFVHTLKLPDEVWAKLEEEEKITVPEHNASYTWKEYATMVKFWNV